MAEEPGGVARAIERADAGLEAMLGRELAEHSRRTADAAERLARSYAVDPPEARLAALLHDRGRALPDDRLVAEAERLGLEVRGVERGAPYLLHARVGAALLAEETPWLPLRVIDAVAAHTVGPRSMEPLALVVYLADAIEDGRTYPGVEALREAVGEVPLEELFLRAYARSVEHVLERRRPIHPDTVRVWNAALSGEAGR